MRVLVSRRLLDRKDREPLIGLAKGDGGDLEIIGVEDIPEGGVLGGMFSPLVVTVPPEAMTRLRFAPSTLADLAGFLAERGVDLPALLAEAFLAALDTSPPYRKPLVDGGLLVLVQMPITSGGTTNAQTIAFLADRSLGQVAVDLGVAHVCEPDPKNPERVNVVRAIGATPSEASVIAGARLLPCDVHLAMDRIAASRFAGTPTQDARRVVLVGAGAIGSHLATCLAREGRYRWTIIDPDVISPHNVARHVAGHTAVFRNKAEVLAEHLSDILDECDVATAIPYDVTSSDEGHDAIDAVLAGADLIIDATASLAAARHLSDHASSHAPTVSVLSTRRARPWWSWPSLRIAALLCGILRLSSYRMSRGLRPWRAITGPSLTGSRIPVAVGRSPACSRSRVWRFSAGQP